MVRGLGARALFSLWETLNKARFYGEPGQLCDMELRKIRDLSRLVSLKKFPVLLNQYFHRDRNLLKK